MRRHELPIEADGRNGVTGATPPHDPKASLHLKSDLNGPCFPRPGCHTVTLLDNRVVRILHFPAFPSGSRLMIVELELSFFLSLPVCCHRSRSSLNSGELDYSRTLHIMYHVVVNTQDSVGKLVDR